MNCDQEYHNLVYIVEVKYRGEVKITTCRLNELPKPRDNSRGFKIGFWDYEQARIYALHVAAELEIPLIV